MMDLRQCERFRLGRPLRRRSKRRIFRRDPAQQGAAFFRVTGNQADTGRRWQERDGWRIDNLEKIETKSVSRGRSRKKPKNRELPAPRRFPRKEQIVRSGECVHFSAVVASVTEVMPCSSAAFATVMASS